MIDLGWYTEKDYDENTIIKCPECNEWTSIKEWKEGETYCEDCGSHYGIICPKCEEIFDHVWHPDFEIK